MLNNILDDSGLEKIGIQTEMIWILAKNIFHVAEIFFNKREEISRLVKVDLTGFQGCITPCMPLL